MVHGSELTDVVSAYPHDRQGRGAWLLGLRATLISSWRPALLLAALFGGSAGIAVAAIATAESVEAAYDRLLAETDAPDFIIACPDCETVDDSAEFAEALLAEPAIANVATLTESYPILYTDDGQLLGPFDSECATGAGELSATTASWARSDASPVRLVSGRLPAAGAADEVALPLITAKRAGVDVGDRIVVGGVCHEEVERADFAPHQLTVVGVFVGFFDVRPPGQSLHFEIVLVDDRFHSAIAAAPRTGITLSWYESGRGAGDLSDDARGAIFLHMNEHAETVRGRLQPDATALRILALLAAIAMTAVLGQLLARHIRLVAREHPTLRALGMTRRGMWTLGMGHTLVIAAGAAAVCVVGALGVLPLIPPGAGEEVLAGSARTIPSATVAVGVAAVMAVVCVVAAVPAWLAARATVRPRVSGRPSLASRFVGEGRVGTTASWGVRLALEPTGGQRPVPTRSGLGAAVIATAVVAGVVTFAAGLEHLRATQRLVGWNWDFAAGGDDVDLDALAKFAAAHPAVARSSQGTVFPSNLSVGVDHDIEVYEFAFETGPDAITPVVISGRAPQGDDELLLNAALAAQVGVDVGDEIAVLADDHFAFLHQTLGIATQLPDRRATSFEVVGIGVLAIADGRLDRGIALTMDGLRRIFAPPSRDDLIALLVQVDPAVLEQVLLDLGRDDLAADLAASAPGTTAAAIERWTDSELAPFTAEVSAHAVYVDLVKGADRAAFVADFVAAGFVNEGTVVIGVQRDGSAVPTVELVALELDDVAWIPAGMGILMAFTTVAVLAHLIATGARARRRDIATLRALGLVGRQARAIVAWQAITLVVVTTVIALPAGVIAGRYAWHRFAEGLGVVPEPVTPWLLLALLAAGLVGAHLLASLLPGRAAARLAPAEWLRSE